MKTDFKKNLVIGFSVIFLILMTSLVSSFLSIKSMISSNSWVSHTQEVIKNLNEGFTNMLGAQTTVRGFLLTGKEGFLIPLNGIKEKSKASFDKVESLTLDNSYQQKRIKDFMPLKDSFFNYLQKIVQDKKNGKDITNDIDSGKKLMQDMKMILDRIEGHEQGLLDKRVGRSEKYGSSSITLIIVTVILAFIIMLIFLFRMLNDYKERAKLQLELEKKDRETEARIKIIAGIASQVSQGNYKIRTDVSENDALGSVGTSLNDMANSLDIAFEQLSEKEWLQEGLVEVNNTMSGDKSLEQLSKDVIEYLALRTKSNAGAIYLAEGDKLKVSGGYSYIPAKDREYIKIGEGLTGQAFASEKFLEFASLQPDGIKISYALGEVKPGHVVSFPLIDEKANGVIELATISRYTERDKKFLREVAGKIAIAITATQNRKQIQELLEETQAQSEELRAQHTELESMNAELEAQTEKLQVSEEELKVQQEELQQSNDELTQRSTLLEEKNTQIQRKTEDLELATRYKSEFLANMSHELRTPLNSILLLSRLLAENNDKNMNEEQVEFAKVIQGSGTGLLGLIDEILDLSKIEAGKMDLEIQDVTIAEITGGMTELFSAVAKDKNIAFNVISGQAPLIIRTDKMRLDQILKNLISNAIKFTSKGSVTLEVSTQSSNNKAINFTVRDTGIGIAPAHQHLIFDAFHQADGSTKRNYGGTGLGLSISRELAKLLNGELTVKSKIGEGSEFTLCVPVVGPSVDVANNTAPLPAESRTELVKNEEQKKKYISLSIPESIPDDRDDIGEKDNSILIVEDDTAFAKSLLEFTRKQGYKGIVTVRGDEALSMALQYKPVGVLLDLQLPIKSGWEVFEELKHNSQTKHIPVHIMSSHKLRQESMLKGAVSFLEKPVAYEQMPEIFKKIEHIMNRGAKKVLILEDNPNHAKALAYFLEAANINSEIKSEINEGVEALRKEDVDCVILDMGIPDKKAYEILESIKQNKDMADLPVIVFTGKSLSMNEEVKIKKYADSIVVKTAYSYQRMLDEVSLFLHLVGENRMGDTSKGKKLTFLNNVLVNKTVLVVDDDVRNIYSLTKALEAFKMKVLTAIDGKEALEMLQENPAIDVVLLDMMMPNMDGYETATKIREDRRFKSLPVIAVTAKAMTGDREKCINAGASDYITKPVDIDQLLSLLRVWVYNGA